MRKLLSLVFTLCFGINCTVAQPQWDGLKQRQHRATYMIVMVTPDETAQCSATAVGPHALLTAQHCDIPGAQIALDGAPILLDIAEKEFDGHDHMILIIPEASFKDRIDYNVSTPEQGTRIYFWGNPRGIRDQYHEGFCTGQEQIDGDTIVKDGTPIDIFMVSTPPGDSGSAIFNTEGRIVGIVTYGIFNGMFAGSYSLNFTKAQIAHARAK